MFKIKNKYINGLADWLQELELNVVDNNIRVEFVTLLVNQLDFLDKARVELIKTFAEKDNEGNPVMIVGDGGKKVYDVKPENMEKLNSEYNKVLELEFSIKDEKLVEQVESWIKNPDSSYKIGPKPTDNEQVRSAKIKFEEEYSVWFKSFS